jgi:radical SAM-linked protein
MAATCLRVHPAMRIQITFSKSGALIYVSNLDLYRLWERAARRAALPLAYSQGFHPKPKIHFASPLPLGFSSRCEVMEMRLNQQLECRDVLARLDRVLPPGLRVLRAKQVDEGGPAVQTQVVSAHYEVTISQPIDLEVLDQRVRSLLSAETLPRERNGRHYDLRPLIEELEVSLAGAHAAVLHMRLRAQEGATGRPDEVLDALGIDRMGARIERTALQFRDIPAEPATAG